MEALRQLHLFTKISFGNHGDNLFLFPFPFNEKENYAFSFMIILKFTVKNTDAL